MAVNSPTEADGILKQVEDRVGGYLLLRGDSEAQYVCIMNFLEQPPIRQQSVSNAAARAADQFDIDLMVDRHIDSYYSVMTAWQSSQSQ